MENEIITNIQIIDYTHEGLGIAKNQGQIFFIYQALIGEIVDIQVVKIQKNIIYAKVLNIITASPHRIKPICQKYEQCGGCNLMHMDYMHQLKLKNKVFENNLIKNKITYNLSNIKPSKKELAYRNKVRFSFRIKNHKVNLGFKKSKTNDVIQIDICHLISENMNKLKEEFINYINSLNLSDEILNKLLSLIIRENYLGQTMLILEVSKESKILYNHLIKFKFTKLITFILKTPSVEKIINSSEVFIEVLGNKKFKISPSAFFQINYFQTLNIYNKVYDLIEPMNHVALDAYCGTGTIGMYVKDKIEQIIGVELDKGAVDDCNYNKQLNNVQNANYIQGDIKKVIRAIYQEDDFFNLLLIDPPRKGIAKGFMSLILEHKPKQIIYISCNPATLIRDIKLLSEVYKLEDMSIYDMFPNTFHIESIVKMEIK